MSVPSGVNIEKTGEISAAEKYCYWLTIKEYWVNN
jgi:hypothetical protein